MKQVHSIRQLALALLVLVLMGSSTPLEGQGLAVRLAPQASSLRWADDVGLEEDLFFGGGLALGFGRFVSLRGSYLFANALQTSLGATDYDGGAATENVLDAELFSTGVEVRIGDSRIAPVLTGTGGVLRMSPQGREDVKQVVVGYGGGIEARIRPWLNGQLLVEDLRFRLDRSTLAGDPQGSGVAPDQDRTESRRSTALTLSLGARLGGGRSSERANALDQDMTRVYNGEGLMVRAELTGGVIRFDNALLLSERPYFGIRGGLDFGPFFGLRGTYAQGAQRDLAGFVGMTAWSGEAQFNVGRVTDWSTHILLGFGQISFDSDFLDTSGSTPDDQNAVIVGAGVGIPVSPRVQILVSLRDHITTVGEISGVSTPNDLRHNFGLSTGLSFLVGGSPRRPGPSGAGPTSIPRTPDPGVVPQTGADSLPTGEPEAAAEPGTEPQPATEAEPEPAAGEVQEAPAVPMTSDPAVVPLPTAERQRSGDSLGVATRSYQSERVVSIPLPTEGELFIRYGPPPAQGAAAVAPTISQPRPDTAAASAAAGPQDSTATPGTGVAAAAAPGAGDRAGVTPGDLAALERRLTARMDTLSRGASVDTTQAESVGEPSSELEALRQQVDELTRIVREGAARGGDTQIIPVAAGAGEEVVTELRDPFFQGLELRVGGSSVRDAGPGASLAVDALFGDPVLGPLRPFAGVHLGQVNVDGSLAGTDYGGSVTSYGVNAGVRYRLPTVRSVEPSLSFGVSGVAGGTRGDSPADADVVESIYGGFVMGPQIALTGAWRQAPDARLQVVGTLGRLWAGSRGGWTLQAGVRWSRPPREETFVRRVDRSALSPVASTPPQTEEPRVVNPPAAQPDSAEVDPEQAALLTRLEALEEALRLEREARQRLQASADSAATAQAAAEAADRADEARLLASARADSLAALSDSLAEMEQRREIRAAEATLESELRDLLGVVPSVQSVRSTDEGVVVVLGGSLFPTGATSLSPETRPAVERVARIVAGGPVERVVVSGHTDATGSPDTNLRISQLRAEAVREVLIESGLGPQLASVVSHGEQQPLTSNDTVDGRRRNRRVEILILTRSPGD